MRRWSSPSWAAGARRSARAWRRVTQAVRRPSRRAASVRVRPSSWTSESMTRASSIAVRVRGGALVRSSNALLSAEERASSTTTGTWVSPAAAQRASRLRPSTTSHEPSACGTTRSGKSPRGGEAEACGSGMAERKGAKLVRSCSRGRWTTRSGRGAGALPVAVMTAVGSRPRGRAACRRSDRDRRGWRARGR